MEERLNWSLILESIALFVFDRWSYLDTIELGAVLGFLGSLVVGADILEETVVNSIVDVVAVDTIGNYPWDIFVRWGKRGSLESYSMLKLDGIFEVVAGNDSF